MRPLWTLGSEEPSCAISCLADRVRNLRCTELIEVRCPRVVGGLPLLRQSVVARTVHSVEIRQIQSQESHRPHDLNGLAAKRQGAEAILDGVQE